MNHIGIDILTDDKEKVLLALEKMPDVIVTCVEDYRAEKGLRHSTILVDTEVWMSEFTNWLYINSVPHLQTYRSSIEP